MLRFLAAAVVCGGLVGQVSGAEVTKLVVKCVEKAEATPDDLFLEFIVDGKPVMFGDDGQPGTSSKNTVNMSNGDVLTLNAQTLAALKFNEALTINIKDKDITRNEPIGTVTLKPENASKTYWSKGQDVGAYEYHVDYTTTK